MSEQGKLDATCQQNEDPFFDTSAELRMVEVQCIHLKADIKALRKENVRLMKYQTADQNIEALEREMGILENENKKLEEKVEQLENALRAGDNDW